MPLHLWHCVQPYAWSLCICGKHRPPLPVKLAWCSSGLRLPPPSCYSDHHQAAAALRRRLLARRLRSLQSRCRRRSRLVSELDSAYREALLLYRLLVPVVIRNLRSNRLSGPQEITAVTLEMLVDATKAVRQSTAALANQQIRLARLKWFGSHLQTKLHRDQKRIREAMRLHERLSG